MNLIESTKKNLDVKQIESLRDSVGWHRHRGPEKWKEILEKSSFVYSVWDGNLMVGMGRILEDGIMCMLYDIVVHKDYQGKGIGKMIMNSLISQVNDKGYTSIGVFASPENKEFLIPFYKKFGFKLSGTGMEIKR
ncbi:TPA: GNAT family N-acetyltransferase [Candidatus Falkowbacteria bacterium]|nr:MAG: GCN5-related N-acetyltransferase [Candidatus Falkowbacteria bacterium GW2011_GWF2_43_32]HBA37029.1 GNAT family N-acetyltransferase [Candidatus Falkowbacteria bacterium]